VPAFATCDARSCQWQCQHQLQQLLPLLPSSVAPMMGHQTADQWLQLAIAGPPSSFHPTSCHCGQQQPQYQ
jgi:hypothetical protein